MAFGVFPLFLPLVITAFGGSEGYCSLAIIAFGASQFIVPKYSYRLGKMETKESSLLTVFKGSGSHGIDRECIPGPHQSSGTWLKREMAVALAKLACSLDVLGLLGLHVLGIICRCPLRADVVHRNARFLPYTLSPEPLMLSKSIPIHLSFPSWYFLRKYALFLVEVVYTPPICITMLVPFASQCLFRSIRVRHR